jgi:stage II sporulation protein GA (sporulation sigma-E factor processing peptidase)
MVVYIDILFAVNLILNYFILLAVSILLKRKDKRLRILAGAAFGALYSLFIFYPQLTYLYSIFVKIIASVIIVLITFKCSNIKTFAKLIMFFYLISFLFGGIIFAVWLFVSPPGMLVHNGVLYIDISPVLLILAGAGCYIIIAIASRLLNKSRFTSGIYSVDIEMFGISVRLDAMLDTGNSLCDTITGAPVIVVEYAVVEKLIPIKLRNTFKKGFIENPDAFEAVGWGGRLHMIPYGSVGDTGGLLPAFRPDRLTIKQKDKNVEVTDVLVAVCGKRLSGDGKYAALLNPMLTDS